VLALLQYRAVIEIVSKACTEWAKRVSAFWLCRGVFAAAEGKVRDAFEGNVAYNSLFGCVLTFFVSYSPQLIQRHSFIFLGTKYTPQQLNKMFYPISGGQTTFKFPEEGKFRIEG
jgi:hypothetical protein